ncbi:hypothetical protein COCCADRAFT_91150 [Bipolaris zeicola 26-R-13]|uniref:Uncharacterized protein n=1 Tax=Cochliobolus carbonum (strain 26-R-13) TaxID=930089 RepID=W6YCE2_COCC2|nr:uncharacterized protein COCCADRAFT_91150 [Bipolaris zeicola 26-R-13]EUC35318.1 hypothetical protein COCCADRAFT_91150 [Bipolaris zeicola 26-R-13]
MLRLRNSEVPTHSASRSTGLDSKYRHLAWMFVGVAPACARQTKPKGDSVTH